jgi:hypothetical protein
MYTVDRNMSAVDRNRCLINSEISLFLKLARKLYSERHSFLGLSTCFADATDCLSFKDKLL